jgi:hypothetical protein
MTPHRSRGLWLLLGLALLSTTGLSLWRAPGAPAAAPARPPAVSGGGVQAAPRAEPTRAPQVGQVPRTAAPDPAALAAQAERAAAEQAATGPLEGRLSLAAELSAPEWFELVGRAVDGQAWRQRLPWMGGEIQAEVPVGEWDLTAEAPGLATQASACTIDRRGDVAAWFEGVLAPTGTLTLCLVHADGRAVPDLDLALVPLAGGRSWLARTNGGGCLRYDGLPQGDYELHLGDPLFPTLPPQPLAFRADDPPPPPLVLPELHEFEVRVLDPAGHPVVQAEVVGLGRPGGRHRGRTAEDGRVRLRHLAPGTLRLLASHDLGRADLLVEVGPGRAASVELVLRRPEIRR